MKRSEFIKALAMMGGGMVGLGSLAKALGSLRPDEGLLPALFIGHGSPKNAISENSFTRDLAALGQTLPRPRVILVVSAHWLTRGSYVTANPKPAIIYDFFGYEDDLYHVKYPAVGSPAAAKTVCEALVKIDPMIDQERGLDHGAWSVLKHLCPAADIPVLQLSIDRSKTLEEHFRIGKMLRGLRAKGFLIVCSGNITNNLAQMAAEEDAPVPEWAEEFDIRVANFLERGDDQALIHYESWGKVSELAHPSNDHFLPLLYACGLRTETDTFKFVHEGFAYGTLSMRSFQIG